MSEDSHCEEYKDLSTNMRHYASMRFAQLTLYFALSAGLVTAVFMADPPLGDDLTLMLKIIGVLGSAAFGVMEERAADYWHRFCRRAVELEKELEYKQYTVRSVAKLFSATNATRAMIWGGSLLWLAAVLSTICSRVWGR